MKTKKEARVPTGKELTFIIFFGFGCMSFGLLLIWIPFIGIPILLFGLFFVLAGVATIVTKMLK